MNKKNVDYILSSTDGIELLANLFQKGMALDLVDVTRARDNVDLPEDERHIYDMADSALDRVDLDKLYENAGDFELQDKYPEFFDYLQSLQRDRENDEPERVREDETGEAEEEIEEELEEGAPEPLSTRDTVIKNIVEGEHTGKESDSRKYVEKDEYRAKLDAEREESIRRALEADEALNKERELASREADAARLREQEFFDKRKAEEADFDEKARREKDAERYTEKDIDRSKSFEDRKDEAKIDKNYSTNADKQVDSSFRSDAVDNAGDAGKHEYQQSEQVNNMHGGANDAGDVSNAIHSKTYGTETAAETAATAAAMEMARREAAAKAQVGYGNTRNEEAASKAETEKRNAEKYDSDKRETSKSKEESSRLDNSYSSKAESQIDGNSRTGSVNDAGDAGKRGYQQSEQIGSTHYGDSNAGDVTHVVKNREYETSKETADARREVDEAVRRDTAAREQKEAEGDRRSRREQEERRERQERAERRADSYGSDTALRDEDTKREIERRQHEAEANRYHDAEAGKRDQYSGSGKYEPEQRAETAMREEARREMDKRQQEADKYRNAEAGKNETDTKSERESGNRVNNDYNSNRESQIDSSSRTGSVNDAGDAGTRSSMQSERVENLHNGNTNVGDVTNVVGGKTYASEAAAAVTAAADEMSRRESAVKEQRDADRYNGSSKYEPEQRTEDAMREETRREMDRRQQEADRYRNSETGRSETDAKRGENGTGNRVDNSYNSNRDRQVDSSSRTGSVHDAGNAGTRNSMQSEQVGNLHNGSTNAGDVTNVIGGRTHASDAAAATAATVTATAAAAEMTRREAAAKEQRGAEADQYRTSEKYEPERRTEDAMREEIRMEMDRRQREADIRRDDSITSPEKNQERPAGHRIDNNYNTQPGRQIDGTFKTGTISEAGKNASQPEKIDSVHGGSSTAKESLNAIKAKDYSSGNKSTTTPVQPIFKNKDSVELKKNGESKIDNIAREPGSSASTQNIGLDSHSKKHVYERDSYEMAGQKTSENFGKPDLNQSALEKNIKDSKKQLAKEGSRIIDSENKEHIYTAKDGNKNNHVQINKAGAQVVDGHVSKEISGPADNVIKTPGSSKLDVSKAVAGQVAAAAAVGGVTNKNKSIAASANTSISQDTVKDVSEAVVKQKNKSQLWNQAINNTQNLTSKSNKLIADSYAMAGQIDAETAKMIAEFNNNPSFGFSPASGAGFSTNGTAEAIKNATKSSIGNSIAAAKIGADIYNASSRVKNVGLVGAIKNNEVGLKIDGRMKFFTIRSDGTINVDGVLLNVYKTERSNLVFVGWKDAFVNGNEIITSNNVRFQIGSDGNSIITGTKLNLSLSNKELNATDINKIGEKLVEPGIAASFAPAIVNKTISADDFVKDGDSFATNKLTERFGDRNLSNLLRRHQISGTIDRQGRIMHVMMTRYASNEMRKITFSKESIDFIAQNYNKIISVNADTASKIAKINSILEDRHLSDIEKECLFDLRTQLADKKMSCNVDKLKRQLKAGHLDEESARLAQDYINVFENTRKTIIKNGIFAYDDSAYLKFQLEVAGLPTNVKMLQTMMDKNAIPEESMKLVQSYIDASNGKIKRGVIEDGFFAASMAMLVEANNLPSNRRALKKLLKTGNVTEEQKAIIKNMLKINRINGIRNFVARQAHKLQREGVNAYRKSKNFLNKYMGSDYTFRGLMIMLGGAGKVRSIAMKAYRTIKFVRSVPMKFARAVDATRKAAISVAKVSTSAFRASQKALTYGARFTMSTGRLVKRKGAKFTVKRRGKRAIRKFKMLGNGIKNLSVKSLKTMLQIIIRLLTMLGTAILSAMAPILLILLFVLILIFSILSFISNEGDEVYYDAGDEDTTEAAQEMVDLLTLCHASFRSALSGGSSGGETSASGEENGTPQLQKGDSSKVEGLYNVKTTTWWNNEGNIDTVPAAVTGNPNADWTGDCKRIRDKLRDANNLYSSNGYAVTKIGDKTVYLVAMGTYWGKDGDVLKVTFNNDIVLGDEPATNEIYVLKFDTKAWEHTGYLQGEQEGIYGHHLGDGRDFLEFLAKDAGSGKRDGIPSGTIPQSAVNLGNILDDTCDLGTVGGGLSTNVNKDVFYRQEIDQDVYRDIIDQKNNIYYTFPEDKETPDGISPTPTPEGYDKSSAKGAVYGFYNNNQELISMILAMYDFDINDTTSVKKTILAKEDKSGINEEAADEAHELDVTNKIDDDTWKLIAYFDKYGLDMTNYTIGGYDDLRYSTLVALFNASHIITWTPVTQYHQGPDGLPTYNKNGKAIDETNTDGMTYQVPVMVYDTRLVSYKDGTTTRIPDVHQKTDANGDLVFETKYKACPGHKKTSTAVITLHFDSLLDIKGWYDKNIYGVDDFDKENPNYSSNDMKKPNYKAKESVLKNGIQKIKKPEFKMGIPGTCSDSGETSSGSFSPGVMTESQKEVCQYVYKFLTKEMTPKLTREQAIGVLVNIKHECEFNYTDIENPDGSGGYGLAQWTAERRTNLVTWCNNHGLKYNTLEGQCKYLEYEFSSSAVWTNSGVNGFLQCSSAYDAGRYFLKYFERPAAKYEAQREASLNQDIATIESML